MLAVIHEQQELPVLQVCEQKGEGLGGCLVAQVKGQHDGVAHQAGISKVGQLDQPGPVAEAAPQIGPDPDAEAALSHASWTDQADQARLAQRPPDFSKLIPPADEAGRLGR